MSGCERSCLWEKELTEVPGSEDDEDDVLARKSRGGYLTLSLGTNRRRNQSVAERREGRTRVWGRSANSSGSRTL